MSQTHLTNTRRSNYHHIFENALETYKTKTGKDLASNPLLRRLEASHSPNDILNVLREHIPRFDQPCRNDDRLTKCLNSTVNVLYAVSTTIGGKIGSVWPPASVIFTGIGVFLSAAKAVSAGQDVLVDLFERIENFLRRLETYVDVQPTPGMTDILVKVMAEVLFILGIATKEINQNSAKTFLKKLVGRTDIDNGLRRLDKLTHEEIRMATAEGLKATHGVNDNVMGVGDKVTSVSDQVQGVHDTVKRVDDKIQHVEDRITDWGEKLSRQIANDFGHLNRNELRQKINLWLSPPDPSVNYNTTCATHHEGTGVWFTESSIFKDWKVYGSLLWLYGKPGSGKSVLTSAIIRDIKDHCDIGSAYMAYFFFDFRDKEKQNARALLTSILVQLSNQSHSFCDILLGLYSAHSRGSQQPSDSSLLQGLRDILEVPTQVPTYIIIDALDECPDTPGTQSSREKVLDLAEVLVGLHLPNLRLYVTSRPEVDIRAVLEPLSSRSSHISLHDADGQKKDIVDYIRSVVHSDRKMMKWREEDRKLVIQVLSGKADGTFRWVSCQLETVRHCLVPSVQHVLAELPETLDETYERVLQEIPKANREHAHRLLQCLTVAVRPLRVQELAEVLAIDFNAAGGISMVNEDWRWEDQEHAILSACSSLITVVGVHNFRVVQFSHFSVKEFLTSDRLAASKVDVSRRHHIRLEPAHAIMARVCIGVLLRLERHIDEDTMKRFPLVQYAAMHLADHVEFENVISHISDGIDLLLDADKQHFSAWMSYRSDTWRLEMHVGRLKAVHVYHVANLGFFNLVQHLIAKRPQDIVASGGGYGTALHAALRGRHPEVFRLLLSHSDSVDVRNSDGQTLLHLAASDGLPEYVQMLIGRGAHIDARDNGGLTPLHQTLMGTYASLKDKKLGAMRLLLEHGADVDARNSNGSTPLVLVAKKGNLDAAQLLLEHDASVHIRNKDGQTPLHCASSGGYLDIIRILLQYGADIEAQDGDHATALHVASRHGKLEATQLLLEHGATVHLQDSDGSTALHGASSAGYADVMGVLLEHGSIMDTQDNDHRTSLHIAASSGKPEAVHLLLGHGANVDMRSKTLDTPLHFASQFGDTDIVLLLLGHGADVHARNVSQATPLHLAVIEEHQDATQLLLQHGAIADTQDDEGETPLHYASSGRSLDILRNLLEHGADTNILSNGLVTPLHIAADAGKLKAARLLLQYGANIHIQEKSGETSLHIASRAGCYHVVRILLEHGAMVHVRSKLDQTPLHLALYCGDPDVVRLLLEHGADAETQDADRHTPLHLATRQGELAAARQLLEHGAIVHAQATFARTPLHFAAWFGHPELIQLLLEYSADVEAQDDYHNTPLHLAAGSGEPAAAQLLLDRGAVVDARDSINQTPLHLAASFKHADIIHPPLEHGADVEAQAGYHVAPLGLAASQGTLAVAQLMLDHGAIVHVQDMFGRTPLHDAVSHGYLDMIQLLLKHGADVGAQDRTRVTPLHLAAELGKLKTAQVLLKHGADTRVRDKKHRTPFDLASVGGHQEIIELLTEHV